MMERMHVYVFSTQELGSRAVSDSFVDTRDIVFSVSRNN